MTTKKIGLVRSAMTRRLKPPHPNPAIAVARAKADEGSEGKFAERTAWYEANDPPFHYLPNYHSTFPNAELALQRLTVEYLKGKLAWNPAPNTNWRDYAVEAAAASVHDGLRYLQSKANEGESKAIAAVASETIDMVKSLNSLVLSESHRQKLIPFARKCLAWPALKARRNIFSDDHDELIRVLQVGKDTIFGNDSQARFNPKRRFAGVAMEIIERIEGFRTAQPAHFNFLFFFNRPPPDWAREARKLPPFGKASKFKWWSVAERVLAGDCADPSKAEGYYKLVTAPSHEHRKKSVFINKIREEFDTLADIHRRKK